jgi:hypothetical protein
MLTFPTIRLFSLATGLLVSVVVALLTLGGIAHAQPVPQVERQPEIQSEDLEAFESRRLKEIEEEEHSGEIHIEDEKAQMAQELEGERDRLDQQIEQQKLQMDQELDELRDLIKLEQENDAYLIGRREELSRQQAQLDQVIEECGNQGEACSVLFGGSYETESSIESGMLVTRMNISDRERQLEADLLGRTRNMMDDHNGRLVGSRRERDNTLERMEEDHRQQTNTLHRQHQDNIQSMKDLLNNELRMRGEDDMRREQMEMERDRMERETEMREKEGEERREMEREQMERETEMREKEGEERREMERERMEREEEMRREQMESEAEMRQEQMELDRQRMQSGQPGVQPVGGKSPQSGPSRGLFSNRAAGEATSGIDNIMDPTMLTIIGIALTVFTTGMTLFRGN